MHNKKKTRVAYSFFGLIVLAVLYYVTNQMVFKPRSTKKQMQLIVDVVNEECPCIVDQFSSLDSAHVVSAKKIDYYKTLYMLGKEEINFDSVNKYIKPDIIEKTKEDRNFNFYRANNITVDHIFYDKRGDLINTISITPNMYAPH